MSSNYGIPETPFPKMMYKTPSPQRSVSETYEITIEAHTAIGHSQRCWTVREMHGWYDETTKNVRRNVETIHPTDPQNLLTVEEASRAADEQVLFRAKQGFNFLFIESYKAPWLSKFEFVLSTGEMMPLP